VSLEKVIESQIQEAIAAGAFDNLPGAGKPQEWSDAEKLARDNWLGYKVLQNGGMVPAWLGLGREIEMDLERLAAIDRQHESLCAIAAEDRAWARYAGSLRNVIEKYEELARAIRKKQDRFNHSAPGLRSERPGIWVESHLDRLHARVKAAGGPL